MADLARRQAEIIAAEQRERDDLQRKYKIAWRTGKTA